MNSIFKTKALGIEKDVLAGFAGGLDEQELSLRSSFFKRVFSNLKKDKFALIGLAVIVALLFIGLLAPVIAPNDPLAVEPVARLRGMSWQFPLGTDHLGRCVLSRLIYATRTSLTVALIILAGNLLIGIPMGIAAGYCGGQVDNLIMRIADIALTFPSSLVLLAVIGIFGTNMIFMILVLTLLWWAPYARIVRGMVMQLKEKDFVLAAKAAGKTKSYILIKHILLCSISPVIVLATLKIAAIIMHAAAFSFIGIGTQPPNADWGVMLNDGRQFISTNPMLIFWPALVIVLVAFSLNIFGEGLKDALLPGKQLKVPVGYKGE